VETLRAQAARTRAVVGSYDLADIGQRAIGGDGADPPSLERVLFHRLQEYARYVGHLHIVSEHASGQTGK
jgi:Protein of unknown function (DUF664)